jgi:integrase
MNKLTTTRPLSEDTIAKIKKHLSGDLKWLSLFTVSVNSAFRATDHLRLHVDEISDDGKRITIFKREQKTRKNRRVVLGIGPSKTLRTWIKRSKPKGYVWTGLRGPHTHGFYGFKLKEWCEAVGASTDHVATHSTRKSFVRIQHQKHKVSLTTLQWMLNHQSPAQTLEYVGLLTEDADRTYMNEI